jgi:6-pyruvoyltetrahydropterin/6-carboxytetrahydropterin synthase
MSKYLVRVSKDSLVFSAGHFITLEDDLCERVHGHNWRVALELEGVLNEQGYVFDFIALLDLGRSIVERLDHRMLLPDGSGSIGLSQDGPNLRVTHGDRYWSFPKQECVVLPVANTTTERIATWIAHELRGLLAARGLWVPQVLRVELEENVGQLAWVEVWTEA